MSKNYSVLCCFADVDESCRLEIRKDDELVTVIAENARKRDCFSYRRNPSSSKIAETLKAEPGKVGRITHTLQKIYV